MKTFLVLLITAFAAACTLQSAAVKACSALSVIYAHYDEVAADGVIPAKYMNNVDRARALTDRACANPQSITTVQLAGLAGEAYLALRAAFRAGQGQGGDDAASIGLEKLEDLKRSLEGAQ